MSGLAGHVEDYLRLRRALGFKLRFHGQVVHHEREGEPPS